MWIEEGGSQSGVRGSSCNPTRPENNFGYITIFKTGASCLETNCRNGISEMMIFSAVSGISRSFSNN
jgi:hypothetical protein